MKGKGKGTTFTIVKNRGSRLFLCYSDVRVFLLLFFSVKRRLFLMERSSVLCECAGAFFKVREPTRKSPKLQLPSVLLKIWKREIRKNGPQYMSKITEPRGKDCVQEQNVPKKTAETLSLLL